LDNGDFVAGGTVVCTVGSSPSPVLEHLAAPKSKGRVEAEPDMRVRGFANIWATGDCAQIVNANGGELSPPTGQFAARQGRQCAQNIIRVLKGEPTRPFSFAVLGQLCSIGAHSAVAEFFGVQISGLLAWFLWRSVYLFKLPTWARRFQVAFDWAWLLLFPRDLAHLRTRPTDRVARAHYRPGDMILQRGEISASFYVIESGEVDVVRAPVRPGLAEVVQVLGPSSFFGEKALLAHEPLAYSVRARTTVKILVMGRNVFTYVSDALAPLRDAVAEALNRKAVDLRSAYPEAFATLQDVPVGKFMEALPEPLLTPTATLREVGRTFAKYPHEVLYVCSDDRKLEGVVTMTDWMRALSRGASPESAVTDAMVRHPITIAPDEDAAAAAEVMREYRLKNVPVVENRESKRVVGCLRTRRLMAYVFNTMGAPRSADGASREGHDSFSRDA